MSDQENLGAAGDEDALSQAADLQREIDEALGDMSIEQLLKEETLKDAKSPEEKPTAPGIRRGTVIAIQGDDVFVDLGQKDQGILPASQFSEEPLPEVGDQIEVTVARYDSSEGLLILSRQGAVTAATWETIEEGQIVEGRVTGVNKGGLELTISGIHAFMPISQIEMFHVETPEDYLDQRLQCQVMEVDLRDENVVVSRRAMLELEAEGKAQELWENLAEGQRLSGIVRSIQPYGAFVDIGGVDGLLHVSDMSHARVEDPSTIVQPGEQVEVMVLRFDRGERRISLGLKQILPDPWADAQSKWGLGEIVTGRVTRLADFGAFVELTPGVEGLVPISELSFERRVRHPREVISEGEAVKVRVIGVDAPNKRITLSLKRAGDDPWVGASVRWAVGSVVEGRISRIADFGAFVELTPGVEALVHISELSSGFVRSVAEAVREGDTVQAKVMSVDEDARRISLSIKQLSDSTEYTGAVPTESESPATKRKRKKPLKGGLD